MEPQFQISLLGVLVAAVANMAVGAVWYSPSLLGNRWLSAVGWSRKELEQRKKDGMAKAYGGTFIASLGLAYLLAHCVGYTQVTTLAAGAILGFWLWLGFIVTTSISAYLFEDRPLQLYAINTGCYLASFVVMGAILTLW